MLFINVHIHAEPENNRTDIYSRQMVFYREKNNIY